MNQCRWKNCSNMFEPKTHNQIYCSDECCKNATNYKIMERYYAEKARKAGENLTCERCGQETLSRFSTNSICSMCRTLEKQKKNAFIKKKMGNVRWT